jgi:hypothetical protein
MNTYKLVLCLCLCIGLALMPVSSVRADDTGNQNITPVITITPNLFKVGTTSNTFVCLTNGNPNSSRAMQTGDSFNLTFDASIGALTSFDPAVMVNSATLTSADFLATSGNAANKIVMTYVGASKVFAPGDSLCLKVTVAASTVIGAGKVNCEVQPAKGLDRRYNDLVLKYTTISVVDFATGPQGDKGDKGDQGDKGDKGDKGDQGAQGPSGVSGHQIFDSGPVSIPANSYRFANVACIAGKRVIGGGVRMVNYTPGNPPPTIFESGPQSNDGWFVGVINTNAVDALVFKVYAICATAQ